jgi:hypothetical protein
MRPDVETNELEGCGYPRAGHGPNGCRTWIPGTRDAPPRQCGSRTPTPTDTTGGPTHAAAHVLDLKYAAIHRSRNRLTHKPST